MVSRCLIALRMVALCLAIVAAAAFAGTLPPAGPDGRIACPYCDLRKADLAGRDLRYANFAGANLAGANLNGANLGGAAFPGANLTGADLRNATFDAATDLTAANLTNARLSGTTPGGAIVNFATLPGTGRFEPAHAATASDRYFCGAKDTTELPNKRYVAPGGADNATCGASFQVPCATIARGIAHCTGAECSVLVAYAEYKLSEPLQLTGGVSVYGGCAMLEQPRPELRSLLRGPVGAPAVVAPQIVAPTMFQGFSVFAGAGRTAPGEITSVAFASIRSSGITLESVSLVAGVGAPAQNGREGRTAPRADNGRDDIPGRSPGNADGGFGGDIITNGGPGFPGDTGHRARGGTSDDRGGGIGDGGPCRPQGTPSPDVNGSIRSSFTWAPSIGGAGQKGGFGGGGGGGRGTAFYRGGGGGAGGEGGGGGEGGTQGSASIALLIAGGQLRYNSGSILAGVAAAGGRGGGGAPRGEPGSGAKVGGIAGNGGDGGYGGPGAGGAGGNGGPAFAVVTAGTSDADGTFDYDREAVQLYGGTPGTPGDGGPAPSPCSKGAAGLPGITRGIQRLELKQP